MAQSVPTRHPGLDAAFPGAYPAHSSGALGDGYPGLLRIASMARDDLGLLALMAIVAIGLFWALATGVPIPRSVRAVAAILLALQVIAVGALLILRARTFQDQVRLGALVEFKRLLSDVQKHSTGIRGLDESGDLRASLRLLAVSLGARRILVSETGGPDEIDVWCGSAAHAPAHMAHHDGVHRRVGAQAIESGALVRLPGVLAFPLRGTDRMVGALTLISDDEHRRWSDEDVRRGHELADVLALALVHVRDRRDVRETADFSRAVLASVSGDVAVLDAAGVVVTTNASWAEAVAGHNPTIAARPGMALIDSVSLAGESRARLAAAIEGVLAGERPQAAVEYSWDDAAGRRWSEVRIQRLNGLGGGAVLTHLDVTSHKRVEADAQRHLHELAHVNMVSGMGELAAAVAHELNQPLTAVLSNAQAARRIMMGPAPALDEVREILDDIIDQDKRAGDVIQRIRRVLRKEQFDWRPLDFNALIRDVIHLLSNQATLGGVSITSTLLADLPPVRGDRVQLQQVVLNLMLNGIQASVANDGARKPILSLTTGVDAHAVCLFVHDSGAGIPADSFARIFDPFYTTKTDGFGMGLSISRSIVELHGGQLTVANHASGGAEFSIALPAEDPS
jgi:signal transduction histidine kinase